jgi:arginine decarboxylase
MMEKMPKHFFLVTGASEGKTPLNAFDRALLDAGIGNTNLIKMSSIIPPGASKIDPVPVQAGIFLPVAYSTLHSDIPGEVISAAVAAALPNDPILPGVIMEYSAHGRKEDAESVVTAMARDAMAYRGISNINIFSASREIKVQSQAAIFAAVVLWG